MVESKPNPTSAMDPAATPAEMATTASTRFQAIVSAARRSPRRRSAS